MRKISLAKMSVSSGETDIVSKLTENQTTTNKLIDNF